MKAIDIKNIRVKLNLNQQDFANLLGVSKRSVANYESGDTMPNQRTLVKIKDVKEKSATLHFNESSPEYVNGYSKEKQNKKAYKKEGVPFYGSDITSTITGSFSDIPEIPEFYIDIPPLNDCDAWFTNRGDSMYPKYRSGQMLAVKTIANFDAILPGESYLIITDSEANNLKTVKNVHFHKDDDKLILRAKNPDFAGDTILLKKNILSLHLIKADLDITHN